jgi:Rrf2 family iron-sulfur cluster assembly transcriptional regulator
MLALSQTTGYAIQALACVSEGCDHALVREVARCAGVPAPYLGKIVQNLVRAGILNSRRGRRGGISLARPSASISLLEISEAVDGADYLEGCLLGLESCSDQRACPTHAFWKKTRGGIRRTLKGISLAEVAQFQRERASAARRVEPRSAARSKKAGCCSPRKSPKP